MPESSVWMWKRIPRYRTLLLKPVRVGGELVMWTCAGWGAPRMENRREDGRAIDSFSIAEFIGG